MTAHSSRLVRHAIGSVVIIACLTSQPAAAHAPPEISRILFDPGGARAVLVTNRGLVFGTPATGDWHMMCSTALGIPLSEQPDLAYLADGRLLAATSQGLRANADQGCVWTALPPFERAATTALAQDPSDSGTLYLAVAAAGRGGIYQSRDTGAAWSQRMSIVDGDRIDRLAVAPSMPTRIYGSGHAQNAKDTPPHYLLRSSDGGASWQRTELTLRADEKQAVLLAIGPKNPDLLLLLVLHASHGVETEPLPAPGPDRVLVSRDAGASWSELWSATALLSAGFGAAGETVWIAGADGLWHSGAGLSAVQQIGDAQLMSCVGAHNGLLYACGHHSGFDPAHAGVGVSSDDGASFKPWMAFTDVKRTVACDNASNTARVCTELWTDWQLEILVGVGGAPIDSVLPSAAAGSGAAGPSIGETASRSGAPGGSSGCSSAREGTLTATSWRIALILLIWTRRRPLGARRH